MISRAGAATAFWMAAIGAVGCGQKGTLGQSAPLDAGGRRGEGGVSSPVDGGASGGASGSGAAGGGAAGSAAGGVSGRAGAGGGPSGSDAGTGSRTDAGDAAGPPPLSSCARGIGQPRSPAAYVPATVSPCGQRLVIGDTLTVGAAASGQQYVRCGTVGPETSWRVVLSPDAGRLAALTSAGIVRLFETTDWHELARLAAPVGMIDAVAFSPDGGTLATASAEMGTVFLWSAADGSPLGRYVGTPVSTVGHPSAALAFSIDGQRLATSADLVINRSTGALTNLAGASISQSIPLPNPAATGGAQTSTNALQFVGCDSRLLVDSADASGMLGWVRRLSLTDLGTGASTRLAGESYVDQSRVGVSSDGRWVAFEIYDGSVSAFRVHLFDAASGGDFSADGAADSSVVGFSPRGDQLYTTTPTEVQVRIVPSLDIVARVHVPAGMAAVAMSARGEIIASDATTTSWLDPVSGAVRRSKSFPITTAPGTSADLRYGIVSGGGGALFHLWREDDGSDLCAPAPPATAAVAQMALSPDAATLATIDTAGVAELHAIDAGGGVGPVSSSIATGLARVGSSIGIAVANGGTRLAAAGIPMSAAQPPANSYPVQLLVADGASGQTLLSRYGLYNVDRLALSGDGRWVAYVEGNSSVYGPTVTAVDTGATTLSLVKSPPAPQIDSFSLDSRYLAVDASDGIEIWNIASGMLTSTYALPGWSIGDAGLSPSWATAAATLSPIRAPSAPYVYTPPTILFWHPEDGSVVQSLGVSLDLRGRPRFDPSGTVVGLLSSMGHNFSTDWDGWQVWSVSNGGQLRVFAASADSGEPLLPFANGQRLLTRAGSALAVWCR